MKNQKIIVTGGMGYIGSHTVVELLNSGYEIVIADNLCNSDISILERIQKISGKDVLFENIDLSDSALCKDFFEKHQNARSIIHFAALKSVGESVKHPNKYYKNNLFSLINVLDGMHSQNIPNLIFSSSCTVYGQADSLPVTESSPFKPSPSPYGVTKQMSEKILEDVAQESDFVNIISLRYFNPIGAHPSGIIGELPNGIPDNLLPYITQTAIGERENLSVFGHDYNTQDGTAIRDYIHVVDLAQAHLKAMERLQSGENKSTYEVFNLGTGKGYSVLDVIKSFERTSGLKLKYQLADRREGDIEKIYADTTLANNELKWKAQLDLDDMTSSAWKWQKNI